MLAVVRAAALQETDPYWQIRAGVENLSGAPLARPDTWSWAPVGGLFRQTSPVWNDLLAVGWKTLGWVGLTAAGVLSIGTYLLVCTLLARRLGARPVPMLLGSGALLLLALPTLSPRASLAAVTLALLVVFVAPRWVPLVERTRWAAGYLLLAGALVSVLGVWVHLSWFLLGPLAGLAWVWAALKASTSLGRRVTAATAAEAGLLAGSLAGPYGFSAIGYSQEVAEASTGLLLEWISPFASGTAGRWALPALVALAGAGFGTIQLIRQRRRWDQRTTVTSVGILAVAAPASLAGTTAIRFTGLALLVLVPLAGSWATSVADRIALRAAEDSPRGLMRSARVQFWAEGSRWSGLLLIVLLMLLPFAVLASTKLARPTGVLRVSNQLPHGCRLFSDPATSSAVALVRPDVKVWVDGRADYWGRERNTMARDALRDPNVASRVLTEADCVLLPTSRWPGSTRALTADKDWMSVGESKDFTLWVRRPGTP